MMEVSYMKFSVYVVGSNPLPAIVSLCYDCGIVKPDRKSEEAHKALFIYSNLTEPYFKKICTWINEKEIRIEEVKGFCLSDVHNSLAVYSKIKEKIERCLHQIQDLSEIFLNTTGGTKVMATNAILALVDLVKEKKLPADILKELDIDPDKGKLYVLNPVNKSEVEHFPTGRDIQDAFQNNITIDDIVKLYCYKKSKFNQSFTLGDEKKTLEFVDKILKNMDGYQEFQKRIFGYRTVLDTCKKLFENSKGKNCFDPCRGIIKGFENEDLGKLKKFLDKDDRKEHYKMQSFFEHYCNISDQSNIIYQTFLEFKLINHPNEIMTKDSYEFTTGTWLEQYIWAVIAPLIKDNKRYEIQNSFEIYPCDVDKDGNTFEIDLVFRNGYDITFISCTTDSEKRLANSKTREVLANAESLGLRTRTLLICMCKKDSTEFQERNKAFSSQYYRNLEFLCFDDLTDKATLTNKLKKILKIQ